MSNQKHPPPIEELLEKLIDENITFSKLKTLLCKSFVSYITHVEFLEKINNEEKAYEARLCLFRLLDFFDCVE